MPKTSLAVANKKAAPAERMPAVERPHRDLPFVQEELADLCSQIILYGGSRQDLDLILTALGRHKYMNYSCSRKATGPKLVEAYKEANEHANFLRERWYRALCQHWPEPKDATESEESSSPERPVVEMVRADIRNSLRARIEELLRDDHGIETVWLLNEIVADINAGYEPGQAVWSALDRADIYVRVPYKHKKRVQDFVKFLEKGEAA